MWSNCFVTKAWFLLPTYKNTTLSWELSCFNQTPCLFVRSGLLSTLVGEKSVTQRWEVRTWTHWSNPTVQNNSTKWRGVTLYCIYLLFFSEERSVISSIWCIWTHWQDDPTMTWCSIPSSPGSWLTLTQRWLQDLGQHQWQLTLLATRNVETCFLNYPVSVMDVILLSRNLTWTTPRRSVTWPSPWAPRLTTDWHSTRRGTRTGKTPMVRFLSWITRLHLTGIGVKGITFICAIWIWKEDYKKLEQASQLAHTSALLFLAKLPIKILICFAY